jgi:hypothetical protein
VIGDASTTVFSKNRPSGATAYCDSPEEIPGLLASRIGKSGTGALASSVSRGAEQSAFGSRGNRRSHSEPHACRRQRLAPG